ncbi:MAG: outer membrane protein assembly factor BamA [Flavobacteriales bacterium]|nr:MAG: outer membrane protein assembly factor BamA [Flavobacteriales bacterium]
MRKKAIIFLALVCCCWALPAQIQLGDSHIDYGSPREYEIGGITVSGVEFVDEAAVKQLSGLKTGDKIRVPGEDLGSVIRKLWKNKLFSDIQISKTKIVGDKIFLDIYVKEQPRLSRFKFDGVTKTEADNLREDINLFREKIVTEALLINTENTVHDYFIDKGFLNCEVTISPQKDTLYRNHVLMTIDVKKNKKVHIKDIILHGNHEFSDAKVRRLLKETKEQINFKPFNGLHKFVFRSFRNIFKEDSMPLDQRLGLFLEERVNLNIFKTSKYLEWNLEDDKNNVIAKYNSKGFRDAKIVNDTMYKSGHNTINVELTIDEGRRYYFRSIAWVGNTKYPTKILDNILGIKKGDVYNQSFLETRLFMNPSGRDVSSLYMDDGYLFFQVTPVETLVEGDSIDMEIRIYEGKQATINKVTVSGNSKTNDHVIMREIRTKPGNLFSRSDIIRSQRELAGLGYFDPEKMNVTPNPNPTDGTVDIDYQVEEKPSDQIELSGGWGGNRIVGTLGVSLTNMSMRNVFKKGGWKPIPSGDGQRLSVRAQSNGTFFQSYNISFTEPWLGGKKPNSLSITGWHSMQTLGDRKFIADSLDQNDKKVRNPDRRYIKITGVSLGLGSRMKWPDDYFSILHEISYQYYEMNQWFRFIFPTGEANNLFYKVSWTRSNMGLNPIYPRNGTELRLSLQMTPPYSTFNEGKFDDPAITDQDKYRWVEYYKWKFTADWHTAIWKDLVLKTKVGYGFLGTYNKRVGTAPVERFYLGGSGLTGFALDGREIIALRGYDDGSVYPFDPENQSNTGQSIISKYTMELRYPISLNPNATIYVLGFAEAGNTWSTFRDFNPFSVKRSAGVGVRIFLPMFGLLGLDWGYRFDDVQGMQPIEQGGQRSQVHFTIGFSLGEL